MRPRPEAQTHIGPTPIRVRDKRRAEADEEAEYGGERPCPRVETEGGEEGSPGGLDLPACATGDSQSPSKGMGPSVPASKS